MAFFFYSIFIAIILAIYYAIANFRHQLAFFPLYLITKVQKKNFKVVKNIPEIRQILKLSNKGSVIEERLATPAWKPVISLESINGPLWLTMKSNYQKFAQNLPIDKYRCQLQKYFSNGFLLATRHSLRNV
ncbi:Lysosomal beta glucosidase [Brachionus plicatilis]|uniref:Lysosomal beta glucosidase n=1 Tax=Brachionus plicatilis TaxID=10195 RepID=A0A3M7SBH9_BRAPC|nr:Lysosomal beta glucosidase [Brachionus plicatilis]